jgi:paraquat-inducible protein A
MERVACPDCDLLHAHVVLRKDEDARCVRCGTVLPIPAAASGDAGLALVATAAVIFAVAVAAPLMQMSDLGQATSTTLAGSAVAMWREGSPVTAVLVALCAIVAPALQLTLVLAAGVGAARTPAPRWAGSAARLARIVTPWAMPEVMLLATLVAYVKISELAHASPGIGMYATGAVAALLAFARNTADPPTVWARIGLRADRP